MGRPIEIPFETARELLDFLSPLDPAWSQGQYIFRGQPCDEYKLTPSICRRSIGSFAYGSPHRMFSNSSSGQVSFELDVLKKFLDGCDRSGLVVPGYSEQIKARLLNEPSSFLNAHRRPWPQPELYEILAAAQHYEVPTRLLDWTERSYVACYFAASSANFELDSMNANMAIWALSTEHAKHWKTVQIIRTPGGTSRNQAAQSGLFTTHKVEIYNLDLNDVHQPEALEEVEEIYSTAQGGRPLVKMTLPISEAPELLSLCSKLGVDASTLFPGYHGVAKMVRDWANVSVGVRPSRALMDEHNQESYDHDPDFH
ncbi:FRG domain-containing protein [Pseudomonas fluorescens]